MAFGIMQHLNVTLCTDADDATSQGFTKEKEYLGAEPVEIEHVVIVHNGTVGNNPTVDLLLRDAHGNKYIVMVTGRLLASLPLSVPRCPDPECHTDFMDVYQEMVNRGKDTGKQS